MDSMSTRVDRLERMFEEGNLLRKEWGDGRERACLLSAMFPEVGYGNYAACPASLIPEWFARLTPWIDDAGSENKWSGVVRRYALAARTWSVLSAEDWRTLDYRVRAICLREAMSHTSNKETLSACEVVVKLCDRAGMGELVPADEWAKARENTHKLYYSVDPSWVAGAVAAVAAEAAAARLQAPAARAVAQAVVEAVAAVAVAEAEAAEEAVAVAAGARGAVVADRIIDSILSELELTISKAKPQ